MKYYKNLDGVRAIAALMVMIFHYFQYLPNNIDSTFIQKASKFATFGQTGVTLFFVLSGFLITRILINSKRRKNYFKNFYFRRSLRIFPLYYLFLLIYFLLTPLLLGYTKVPFNEQIYFYTFLQNFAFTFNWNITGPNHYWSLAVEEHFYLFWPFLISLLNKKGILIIIILFTTISLFLRVIFIKEGINVFYFTFTRFDSMSLGALLALMELKNIFIEKNSKYFLISIIIIFIPTISLWITFSGVGNDNIQIFKFLFLSLTYFSLIGFILCLNPKNFINRLLESSFFNYTGKISYGLYVYHPLVFLVILNNFSTNYILLDFISLFFFSYLIATISFYLFEMKFLNLKKYFN